MSLPREEVVPGVLGELEAFEALVRSLEPRDLQVPSRCDGWTVGNVASHVIGQLVDITEGRMEGLGTPEVTDREVRERTGRSPEELADELAGARATAAVILDTFDDAAWVGPGPTGGLLGDGVESLWFDAAIHADDIRDALGRPGDLSSALRPSVSHIALMLTEQGHAPVTLTLDGVEAFPVSGGGRAVTGPADEFVRAACGRGDPAPFGLDETANIYR